ncbi:hypothetical protein BX661DRAFT_69731 [Kickxella alabastrina]|uniref:uncharacterized protein n=1 Tax=Kickxella alabastrina TaxID=61397 RepID=UPI00221E99E8|nr:uncharacterized protein BX661DRAFT_69731 [Kickxella alabastrina]KAI7820732.1 hypothetical protein BX661DRAFT_69731 [Kickxella alabastrina]
MAMVRGCGKVRSFGVVHSRSVKAVGPPPGILVGGRLDPAGLCAARGVCHLGVAAFTRQRTAAPAAALSVLRLDDPWGVSCAAVRMLDPARYACWRPPADYYYRCRPVRHAAKRGQGWTVRGQGTPSAPTWTAQSPRRRGRASNFCVTTATTRRQTRTLLVGAAPA